MEIGQLKLFKVTTSKSFDVSCSLNAVFEETDDGILLVDTVVRQSMKCVPSPGQCLTEGRHPIDSHDIYRLKGVAEGSADQI